MQRGTTNGLIAAFAIGLALLATPALAQRALPTGGLTATEIASWLKQAGYPAEVKPDPTTPGDQIISSSTDGVAVDIYLYDCSGDGNARRCTSIQYAAGWPPSATYTVDKSNEWNRSKRYIKSYVTEKGSLFGEYDVDIAPGGTYENMDDTLQNWRSVVVDFKNFFGG